MKTFYAFMNTRNTWYRSVLSIMLGLILVIYPGAAVQYIIMLIGVLFLVTGLVAFWSAYKTKEDRSGNWLSFSGVGSVALGLLLLIMPTIFTAIFMFIMGFALLLGAISQLVVLSMARRIGPVSPVSYLFPLVILLAGIVVIFNPFKLAEGITIIFGVTAIFYGITDLLNQRNLNALRKQYEETSRENIEKEKAKTRKEADIEDADYEEVK